MNELYSIDLDTYGPSMEPPDDYYFLPRWAEQEEDHDDE